DQQSADRAGSPGKPGTAGTRAGRHQRRRGHTAVSGRCRKVWEADDGTQYQCQVIQICKAYWCMQGTPGMGGMTRQLHLNLFIRSRGHHEASWRHPASSPLALTDIRYYQDLARRAEAGLFDSIFLADQLALGDDVDQAARTWLEPVTVLAAVA